MALIDMDFVNGGGKGCKVYIDTANYSAVSGNNTRTFDEFTKIRTATIYNYNTASNIQVQYSVAVLNDDDTLTVVSDYPSLINITSISGNSVTFYTTQTTSTRIAIAGE